MQSDDLDKKIKGLAQEHEPAFEEKAWDKMELLLDKHLPQEKKRRRIYFFLLFALLISIPAYLLLHNKLKTAPGEQQKISRASLPLENGKNENVTHDTTQNLSAKKLPAESPSNTLRETSSTGNTVLPTPGKDSRQPADERIKETTTGQSKDIPAYKKPVAHKEKPIGSKVIDRKIIDHKINTPESVVVNNTNSDTKDTPLPATGNTENNAPGKDKDNAIVSKDPAAANNPSLTDSLIAVVKDTTQVSKDVAVAEKDTASGQTAGKATVKSPKNKKGSRFSINLSLGPDISNVGTHGPGKPSLQYGVGLGYAISDRLVVRSGFYTVKKIYTAKPSDYHPPVGYWTYYTNLQEVDADCKVYEIPLSLLYNFGQRKDHNWFVSAGSSSYIMKRETYGYDYKNMAGQSVYMTRTINNKNKHIFSVLDLSAGYTYTINKKLSFMAEPYLKVPLAGVGFGKVKLNSGGMLFTIRIRPFGK